MFRYLWHLPFFISSSFSSFLFVFHNLCVCCWEAIIVSFIIYSDQNFDCYNKSQLKMFIVRIIFSIFFLFNKVINK